MHSKGPQNVLTMVSLLLNDVRRLIERMLQLTPILGRLWLSEDSSLLVHYLKRKEVYEIDSTERIILICKMSILNSTLCNLHK